MKEFKGEQPYAAPGLVTPAAATTTTRTSLPWCCSIPVKGEQVKLAPGLVTPTSGSHNCDHRSIPENKIKKLSAKKEASRTKLYHDSPIAQCCVVIVVKSLRQAIAVSYRASVLF